MIHRTYTVVLALVIAFSSVAALAETTQLIPWTEDLQLSWGMFQCSVPADAGTSHIAAIYMELKWHTFFTAERSGSNWVGFVSKTIVSNVMNPQLSWARTDRVNDAALSHEIYHFSLNEVYRRKAEAALLAVRVSARTAEEALTLVNQQVCQVGALWEAQATNIQDQYETETNHGLNQGAQSGWEATIDAWLVNPSLAP